MLRPQAAPPTAKGPPSTPPRAKGHRAVGIGAGRPQQPHHTLKDQLTSLPYLAAPATRVYPSPRLSMRRFVKIATPPAAATVVVPERVPPPGLFEMPMVMLSLAFGTTTPAASRIAT